MTRASNLRSHQWCLPHFHIAVIVNNNADYFLVIVVPTSTSQQIEKVERRCEQQGCVIK
jgi:uncharacterized protein YifN (PemK superfamily)